MAQHKGDVMEFGYFQAMLTGGVNACGQYVFPPVPKQPLQVVPAPTTQGSSTNTVYVTGTTQQEG